MHRQLFFLFIVIIISHHHFQNNNQHLPKQKKLQWLKKFLKIIKLCFNYLQFLILKQIASLCTFSKVIQIRENTKQCLKRDSQIALKNCFTKDTLTKKQLKKLHMELYINQNLICQTTYLEMERLQSISSAIFSNNEVTNQQFKAQMTQATTEINLISQYLELSHSAPEQRQYQMMKNDYYGHNDSQQKKEDQLQEENEGQIQRNGKKISLFHNFQKHLITTLKSIIKLKAMPHHKKSYLSIAHDIWEYFCRANKYSKRFLKCLLGKKSVGKHSSRIQEKNCKDCQKLSQFLSQYSKEDIMVAQDHLCKEIIRKSLRLLQFDKLKIRKIKNCEGFISYYRNFVQELENGQLSQRLPKSIKINLIKNQQITQPMEASMSHII